ncbi:MAG: transglycosylase SLT domain-containing protein [Bacteroidales bacterium]|nr:transglycosylase SLT domain-containing protein [Bacteroidales bacterium]MCF8455183.1 transglycosylase SLT domain-containing protein [Bacteroidales bacterium]
MNKLFFFIILSTLLLLSHTGFSFSEYKDTVKLDSVQTHEDLSDFLFFRNLDSLSNLFYVQQSLSMRHLDSLTTIEGDSTSIPTFPDSVYIERLARIPSVFDLSFNDKVKAYLDVYTKKKREKVEIMLGLTDYYFPIFERVLDEYGLPHELKYLPVIESALNPRAVSRAGATGIWQFMYSTGKLYKLEINSYVDERRDPIAASYAAANFLRDLYQMFGDWTLVIAAYNCGPGNVKKAIRRSGGRTNYWDIYYRLPRETRGYVPAFIAATYTLNYYKEHNLVPQPIDMSMAMATDTLMISEELHLKQVSEVLGLPLQTIRDLNPQYKLDIIPAITKSYALNIPVEYVSPFIDLQDSIFTYKDNEFFDPDKKLKAPEKYTAYTAAPPKNSTKLTYRVKSGDNLGFISEWYGVGLSDLRYWNNIHRNLIKVGQNLVVYVPGDKKEKYEKINSMSFAQKQATLGRSTQQASTAPTKIYSDSEYEYYTVRGGDNLWTIAKKFPGVSADNIKDLNNITDTRSLAPGQKLKIRRKG